MARICVALVALAALLGGCTTRCAVTHSGANNGFGFLGDDDDDDDTGGSGGAAFNALVNTSLPTTAAVGADINFQVDAQAGGASQTNGSIRISVIEQSGAHVSSISTTSPAGWVETGWSYDVTGGEWFNTFTRASVPIGTTSILVDVVSSTPGLLLITTNNRGAYPPSTTEAANAGNEIDVTIGSTASLSFSTDVFPDPVAELTRTAAIVTVTIGGVAQTSLTCNLRIKYDDGTDAVVSGAPTMDNADGWAIAWTNFGDGMWSGVMTRASAPIGTSSPIFVFLPFRHGHATIGLYLSAASSTEVPSATTSDDFVGFA